MLSCEFRRSRSNATCVITEIRLSRSLIVTGTDTDRSATCDFLLKFHSSNRSISYHFEDKHRFQSNIAIFPISRVFNAPDEGVPLGIVHQRSRSKKLDWWGYRAEKEVWRYLHPSGYNALRPPSPYHSKTVKMVLSAQKFLSIYAGQCHRRTIFVLIPATPGDISFPATTASITLIIVSWSWSA